jgi:hypothetical protein
MRTKILIMAGAAVSLAATPAIAAHFDLGAGVDVLSDNTGFLFAPLGQGRVRNLNGKVVETSLSGPSPYAITTPAIAGATGAFRPDVTAVSAATGISGGVLNAGVWTSDSTAYANLATGKLGASIINTGSGYSANQFTPFATVRGSTQAAFNETVYFTNPSGGDLLVQAKFRVKGAIIPLSALPTMNIRENSNPVYDPNWANGTTVLTLNNCVQCGNEFGERIRGTTVTSASTGIFDDIRTRFNINGRGLSDGFFGNENSPTWPSHYDIFDNAGAGQTGPFAALIDYNVNVSLIVPKGLTSLGVGARFNMSCEGFFNCAFADTAGFSFSDLPDGLSFTSQSGVFLSGLGNPGGGNTPGVIPEPASWAMMIVGFAIVGAATRRRRGQPA